jgi:hypothetical protein
MAGGVVGVISGSAIAALTRCRTDHGVIRIIGDREGDDMIDGDHM